MRQTVPEDLTLEQFKAFADRKPSLEGNWLYRLIHEKLWGEYEYPEFRIHQNCYIFLSLEEAEKYMHQNLLATEEADDTYRFLIQQVPIGEWENETGATWVYDQDGKLVETSTTFVKEGKFPESSFFGRSEDRIRFHEGDIVEIVERDSVRLAIIGSKDPTVEWFWGLYGRSMIERNKVGKGYYAADYSDDSYYVIDGPGCHAHPHATNVMKPRLPILQDMREWLEECLAMSKSREDRYDRRILGMDSSCIFDAATVYIMLRYDFNLKRHRLALHTLDNITETESERHLPQDFPEEELKKISDWLNFKKYGKTRLWYLIRDWNEYYFDSEKFPFLSPDTPLEELLKE